MLFKFEEKGGIKFGYDTALDIAEMVKNKLLPWSERIEIAGSLRRKREFVKDVELVMVPRPSSDLLGELHYDELSMVDNMIGEISGRKIKDGKKYKKFEVLGMMVDLFIANPDNFGLIYAIRTGSAEFSKWLVSRKTYGGALPGNMLVKDGMLLINGDPVPVREEAELFEYLGIMRDIPPEKRNKMVNGKWE